VIRSSWAAVLAFAVVLLIGYESLASLRPARPPGILVLHAPSQVQCAVRTWRHGKYRLTMLARFSVKDC
jgi:hypothetical protein